MGLKEQIDIIRGNSAEFTLEQKMTLVISGAFFLATNMASIEANGEQDAEKMRESLRLFYHVFIAAFPEGPLEAQAAVQEFTKRIGVMPEETWKVRPN